MRSKLIKIFTLLAALSLFAAACSSEDGASTTEATTDTTTASIETTEAGTDTTEATTEAGPTEVNIALILETVLEEPFNATFAQALDRAVEQRPHGVDVNYEVFENIAFADAERVIRELAVSGKYDIIVANSSFSDGISAVNEEFPDTLFSYSGGGNQGTGGNAYWFDAWVHDCTYLAGAAAAMMSETDTIGAVAAFPFANINLLTNSYLEGARSVNPDIRFLVTYIESWFDPTTALEAARAQIVTGADVIYGSSFGALDAAASAGVLGIGDFVNQEALYPDTVITSVLAKWDPAVAKLINDWWEKETNGTPYAESDEVIGFLLAEGGCDLAPWNEAIDIPEDVKTTIAELREKIVNGEIVVEMNEAPTETR
ncbi:MAG: BMP family protein [Acidimicrobiia bacterium]|nr:BMP family protein [Acidimicrobiia bacterium]